MFCFFQYARRDGRSLWLACPLLRSPRNFLPAEVRPRVSRCLWTGSTIQLIRGSCGTSGSTDQHTAHVLRLHGGARAAARRRTHVADGGVLRVHEDDLEVLVRRVLRHKTRSGRAEIEGLGQRRPHAQPKQRTAVPAGAAG